MAASIKDERLDLRLPAEQKILIERAAVLAGQSVSAFVLGAAIERSRHLLSEANVITLSDRDWDHFLTALDDLDARPNAALLRAIEHYQAAGE
jgi:uncharacterized protein (DUF1778 family)